jgi:hypothetical protein
VRFASILKASRTSESLRASVFSRVRKKVRATCIVMVLAPSRRPRTLAIAGPGHADVVHAPVLVEAVILGGEDRRLHDLRDVLDPTTAALLLAELADQLVFGAVDPQRDLRPVIGQDLQARQVRPKQDDRERADAGRDEDQRHGDQGRVEPPTGSHRERSSAIRLIWPRMRGAGSIYRGHYSAPCHSKALPQNALQS